MSAGIRKLISFTGWLAALVAAAGLCAVIAGLRLHLHYTTKAEQFPLERIGEVSQKSAIYDANGELYSHLPGLNRQIVPLKDVSGWFIQALLAREDSRFWQHRGIEPKSMARAFLANFRGGSVRQGASTITQQLARNAFELKGRTYDRKATEAALALRIEKALSKQQILEHYINRIYFGSGFYGVEAAARGYFGKSAGELSLGESAVLAGLICSPNKFSPAKNLELALAERDEVLNRMLEEEMVTSAQVTAAKAVRIEGVKKTAFHAEEDYLTDAVGRALVEVLDQGVIERGGLKVFCTIDPQLQAMAREAADRQLTKIEEQKKFPHPRRADFVPGTDEDEKEKPTDYLQSAVVVLDNRTGAIRACVGGRDYQESKYHRAILAQRQIGSTFKPFVYAAAFERGLLPGTLVNDDKIAPNELRQASNNWSPENSDGDYKGLQPAAFGLIKSRNTMTVRIGEMVGLGNMRKLANAVGIGSALPDYPVAYLGAFETNLRDLTASYATFPNAGVYRPPHLISRVESEKGEVLYQAETKERRVMKPETAWMVSSCLQEVMRTGTAAKAAQLGWKKPAAGKTGTTNEFKDAWFVGYTSSLTCGVWVGMDKPEPIMEKGYGSALALPIWVDLMNAAPEREYPAAPLQSPVQLVHVKLCTASNACAGAGCEAARTVYDADLPSNRVPTARCSVHADPIAVPAAPLLTGQPGIPGLSPAAPAVGVAPAAVGPVAAPAPVATSVPVAPAAAPPAVAFGRPMPGVSSNAVPLASAPEAPRESYRVVRTPTGVQIYPVRPESVSLGSVQQPVARRIVERPAPRLVERPESVRVMRAIPLSRQEARASREQHMAPAQPRSQKRGLFQDDDDDDDRDDDRRDDRRIRIFSR